MAQETRQLKRSAAREKTPRISERLKLETDGITKSSSLIRHPFKSLLRIGLLSTAMLLPLGTLNPAFSVNTQPTKKQTISNVDHTFSINKKELYFGPDGDYLYQNVVKPQEKLLDMLWDAKVRFASSKFRKQHPDSSLIEQDYGVIKKINDSLPEQRRINAFEWYVYQNCYLNCNLGFSHAPEAMRKRSAIRVALYNTRKQYPEELRKGEIKVYTKKTATVVNKNVPIVKKNDSNKSIQHNKSADDKVPIDVLFFGALAALIWWWVKTSPEREKKEAAYLKAKQEEEWKGQREEAEYKMRLKQIIKLIDTLPEKELEKRRFELLASLGKYLPLDVPADVPDRLLKILPISVQEEIAKAQRYKQNDDADDYSTAGNLYNDGS